MDMQQFESIWEIMWGGGDETSHSHVALINDQYAQLCEEKPHNNQLMH
jgi:hypothetical protein